MARTWYTVSDIYVDSLNITFKEINQKADES